MENKLKTQANKKGIQPKTDKISLPVSDHSIEINRVLEHVSSPFRWELIDIPLVQEKPLLTKKYRHQKSVFEK
jgi:hypothetical protein